MPLKIFTDPALEWIRCVLSEERPHPPAPDIEWLQVEKLLHLHQVLPTVVSKLKVLPRDLRPPLQTFLSLDQEYYRHLARVMAFEHELLGLLDEFQRVGLSVIPFKGPVFARQFYGSIDRRACLSDLDLVVRHHHMRQAMDLLLSLGFTPGSPIEQFDERVLYQTVAYFHRPLEATGEMLIIDLHWNLFLAQLRQGPALMEWLWSKTHLVDHEGHAVLSFHLEGLILAFCIRMASSGVDRALKSFCDLDRLVRSAQVVDWDGLSHAAQDLKVECALRVPLQVVGQWFGTPIPEGWLAQLRPGLAGRLIIRLLDAHPEWFIFHDPTSVRWTLSWWLSSFVTSDRLLNQLLILMKKLWIPLGQFRWERNLQGWGSTIAAYLTRFVSGFLKVTRPAAKAP